jgi:nicotinate-nucleotide pyrophosphorylase (carboxylating)
LTLPGSISARTDAALRAGGLDPIVLADLLRRAIEEDLGGGEDLTSVATIDPRDTSVADFVVRKAGVFAGAPVLAAVIDLTIPAASLDVLLADGAAVAAGDVLATVRAPTIALLTVERTALNLICRLSGIATHTRTWVDALSGTATKVRDTRKTTPGLRDLEKYAVRCGGGVNHRRGLNDAVLIKDNHVLAAGGIGKALDAVHRYLSGRNEVVIQAEIDRLDQLDEALLHGATQILLDNMSAAEMAVAVARVRGSGRRVLLEASGGLTLADAPEVAATGVDFIAVGALTHSSPVLDIALDFRAGGGEDDGA